MLVSSCCPLFDDTSAAFCFNGKRSTTTSRGMPVTDFHRSGGSGPFVRDPGVWFVSPLQVPVVGGNVSAEQSFRRIGRVQLRGHHHAPSQSGLCVKSKDERSANSARRRNASMIFCVTRHTDQERHLDSREVDLESRATWRP